MEPNVEEALNYFEEVGRTVLPDKFRAAMLTIFEKYPDKWFTAEDFHVGLKVSTAFAYKICEAFVIARMVEKKKIGKTGYYRLKARETK